MSEHHSGFLIKAAGIMFIGMMLIPLGDTAGKLLTSTKGIAPEFVAWSRFLIGAVLIFCLMGGKGFEFSLLKQWRIWFRACFIVICITSILTALKTEPISNVFAAVFIGPILSYFLSVWLLGERISLARTILLFLSFCGVLAVIKPSVNMSPGMAYALLAGVSYGGFLLASKWVAGFANAKSLLMSQLIVGAIVMMPWGVSEMPPITMSIGGLVLLSALASALGNLFLILANQMVDASRLAPLIYVQLLSATGLGILVFKEYPDLLGLIGLLLLLSSGLGSFFLGAGMQQKNKAGRF